MSVVQFEKLRLEEDKRIFNPCLSRACCISENAFGILTQCFKVYKRPAEVNPVLADSIVKATSILCNYLHHEVQRQVGQDDSFDNADGTLCIQEIQRPRGNRPSSETLYIQDTFEQYFVSVAGSKTVCAMDS
ncbi:Protein ALP1-like [Scomber scombrus]|uniref:Protein ALP1-like n=1 Tax=Scomber scombrus TaxID=13677 RepID=A0AAV1NXN8_SCOSC